MGHQLLVKMDDSKGRAHTGLKELYIEDVLNGMPKRERENSLTLDTVSSFVDTFIDCATRMRQSCSMNPVKRMYSDIRLKLERQPTCNDMWKTCRTWTDI